MNKGLQAACGLLLACHAGAAMAGGDSSWFVDGEVTTGYDSNVSRAAFDRDIIEDTTASTSLAVAWNRKFGMMRALTLRGFAEGESYEDVDALNRTSGGVQAIYRWQHTLGYTAPFFQVSASGQVDDVRSDLRDSDRYTVQAFGSKRITDALRASLGVEASRQEADGNVFDTRQVRAFVNADLSLTANWALYSTYSAQVGDTVSSAQHVFCNGMPASDIYGLIDASEAIEPDLALNDATCGQWLAYRLPAVTHVMVVGANRGFGHNLSFDMSAQQVLVYADGNNEYQRTIVRAGILARF